MVVLNVLSEVYHHLILSTIVEGFFLFLISAWNNKHIFLVLTQKIITPYMNITALLQKFNIDILFCHKKLNISGPID